MSKKQWKDFWFDILCYARKKGGVLGTIIDLIRWYCIFRKGGNNRLVSLGRAILFLNGERVLLNPPPSEKKE